MVLEFEDLKITVTPAKLNKALKRHNLKLMDMLSPSERRDFTIARSHIRGIRGKTFVNDREMTVYEAMTLIIPKAIQAFRVNEDDITRANRAFKSRFTCTDLYNYIHEAGHLVLFAQLRSKIQCGRLISALTKESPLLDVRVIGNKRVYIWNPAIKEWRLQAIKHQDVPVDERTDDMEARINYHFGDGDWLPSDLK